MSASVRRPTLARRLAAASMVVAAAAGCSADESELRNWMDQVRRVTQPIRDSIPEPKRFMPFRYDNAGQVDPFTASKLASTLEQAVQRNKTGPRPDLERRREVLENYPLEAIRMVGHLADKRHNTALLQVDTMVYQARVGMYAGQNFGRIVKISESEVMLKELVQDAAGEWTERETALRLQESKK